MSLLAEMDECWHTEFLSLHEKNHPAVSLPNSVASPHNLPKHALVGRRARQTVSWPGKPKITHTVVLWFVDAVTGRVTKRWYVASSSQLCVAEI